MSRLEHLFSTCTVFAAALVLGPRSCGQAIISYYPTIGEGTDGTAVSGDGTVSGGNGTSPAGLLIYRAMRWTLAGGMEDLGPPPGASEYAGTTVYGISRDGSTLVGGVTGNGTPSIASLWT